MWHRSLLALDEAAVRHLEEIQMVENLRLEFKRELNLASVEQKREAAKDVSAFANSAGGRIVYGVDERELPDKTVVA